METVDWRAGIDANFRQNVFNDQIIETLREWGQNSNHPNVLQKIRDISSKFEQKIFEKATSKEDYLTKISQKLRQAKTTLIDALAPSNTGNQLTNSITQRQVAHSYPAQESFDRSCLPLDKQNVFPSQLQRLHNPMVTPLTSMQQREVVRQPALSSFHQGGQFGQQIVSHQRDLQDSPLYQQSTLMKEPLENLDGMLNMDRYQRPVGGFHQVINAHAPQMPHPTSSSQLLHPLVNSQEHAKQFQDTWVQGSQMQAPYLHSSNSVGENNFIPQSQMVAANAPSAFPSSFDAEWRYLINQFHHLKTTYLPEVLKLLKKAEDLCAHAQNMQQLHKAEYAKNIAGRMIKFLQLKEHQMVVYPKEKLTQFMDQIIQFVRNNNGSGNPQSSATNQPLGGSQNAAQQTVMQFQLHQNTCLNLKQNAQLIPSLGMNQAPSVAVPSANPQNLQEKKDDCIGSMSQLMSKNNNNKKPEFSKQRLTKGRFTKNSQALPKEVPQSSSVPIHLKNDASSLSNAGATSKAEPSTFTGDLLTAPATPSSVPKENLKPAESILLVSSSRKNLDPQDSGGPRKTQLRTEVQDQSIALGTPGISAVSLPSDFTCPESKQISQSTIKHPVERLIEAVQSLSKETLTSSINDIISAIDTVDMLPEFAIDDEFLLTMEAESENFLDYGTLAMGYSSDGQTPDNNLKRDICSTSVDTSMSLNNADSIAKTCRKKPIIESKHDLVDEIRMMNQRFVETAIEVASDSIKNSGVPEASNGTIVRITYKPVALSENLKRYLAYATRLTLEVEFHVPIDYPDSSPQILDWLPKGCSKESEDLIVKARSRFDRFVRGLPQPISLGEIARAWDNSARSVFSEFALRIGGETFSSKYGTWECVPAA